MLLLLLKPVYLAVFLYNIFILLYRAAIRISSLWNVKARKWINGRKNVFEKIRNAIGDPGSGIIWFHCSSLGEFEQGRPVIEKIRRPGKNDKVLITFFSPSGYEVQKDYAGADYVFYLPVDSKKNAKKFLTLINPQLIIFVKYDLWYHYLAEIKKRNIPSLLISAVFRKEQAFFKWYGKLQKKMLGCFSWIFVQNEESKNLLHSINFINCSVCGDTRFDRVIEIAEKFQPVTVIDQFIREEKCIVAGSTWANDEQILKTFFAIAANKDLKLIIAPHDIGQHRLQELKMLFPASIFFSKTERNDQLLNTRVLIIDTMGLLSRLYNYATIAYVGGGFTSDGVHNVLEAAVYRKPVVFGTNYKKYREASDLVQCGAACSISSAQELNKVVTGLLTNERDYLKKCKASGDYVWENKGATATILAYIDVNRLLTS